MKVILFLPVIIEAVQESNHWNCDEPNVGTMPFVVVSLILLTGSIGFPIDFCAVLFPELELL